MGFHHDGHARTQRCIGGPALREIHNEVRTEVCTEAHTDLYREPYRQL